MATRDIDEVESELSKKQRLINAWIAVGPEGKTTDVSELTDSSRGYASDLRRGLEGENDEEIDTAEIEEAHHPELVEKYRSELGDDAVDGEWEFVDELGRESAGQAEQTPTERATPAPSESGKTPTAARRPPSQPETGASGPERGQRPAGETGRPGQPPQQGRQSEQPSQPGGQSHPTPPPGRQPQQPSAGTPAQGPTPGTQGGQQQGRPTPSTGQTETQPGQHPTPGGQPMQAQQPQQAGQPQQTGQPQQAGQPQVSQQQLAARLRELDNSLASQQQQAQSEINAVRPQSTAQSLAISKYNLIVEMRQSVRELLNTVSPGQ